MGEFGQILLYVCMILSAAGGGLVLGGAHRRTTAAAGRRLLGAAAAGGAVSLLVLVYLLLTHDYRIAYVHEYANRSMPLGYLVTAVWGGQEGSLLLWAVLQTWFTAALASFGERRPTVAIGFLAALQTFFFALVIFHSNPFDPLGSVEMNGVGMNPLLLNPYMTIHPPTLFLGFVGFSVPFALALDALAEGRGTDEWIIQSRPWILFAWLFLSAGNLVGMVWAYQELGWGGYWGWDPVENASFMPWLTGTALLHTAMAQRSRKMFRVLNGTLSMLTFALIVFGTFLTRSGVIQSVHTFAGATVGPYLLGLIVFAIVAFVGLAVFRRRILAVELPETDLLSKENLLLVTAWVLIISAAYVWFATMAPLFTELFRGEKIATTPAGFNRWMVPLGLLILALLGVCALLSKRQWRNVWIIPGTALALGAILGAGMLGFKSALAIIGFGLVGLTAATTIRQLVRIVRGIDGAKLTAGKGRRLGAQIVHLSVAVLFFGFAGGAYTEESAKMLAPNETLEAGPFEITYLGFRDDTDYLRTARFADLRIRTKGGGSIGLLSTARFFYHSHPEQPTSEVAIHTTWLRDLFLILGQTDEATGAAVIRAVVNPLVVWIWIGGGLMLLGTLVSWLPSVRLKGIPRKVALGHLYRIGLPTVSAAAVFGITWVLRGLPAAVAVGIGVSLVALVLLLGQSLISLAEGEAEG